MPGKNPTAQMDGRSHPGMGNSDSQRIGSIVGCFLIIFAGFIVLVLTLCLEALALLLWLFLPLILLVLFVFAVLCLISAAS